MYGLDLFSGIGGLTNALAPYVRPIAYCERDKGAQAVLLSSMYRGELPAAPIWDDIKTLHGANLPEGIEIVYGGFPCQDISLTGLGKGLAGESSGLFFEVVRIVSEIKPRFVFLENVPAIRTRGADVVVKELASIGYDCRWGVLSAYDVGAPHKRDRWFLMAHASCKLPYGGRPESAKTRPKSTNGSRWAIEPSMGRVAYGLRGRVYRLRGLGNAVVPQQAREAFERLVGLK